MIETTIRLVASVLWEFVLYWTGRLAIAAATLGAVRAEKIGAEHDRLQWFGLGRGADGVRIVSSHLTGLIGGALWLGALIALFAKPAIPLNLEP